MHVATFCQSRCLGAITSPYDLIEAPDCDKASLLAFLGMTRPLEKQTWSSISIVLPHLGSVYIYPTNMPSGLPNKKPTVN